MTDADPLHGVLWKLHIWAKGKPDASLKIPDATGDELTRLVEEVEAVVGDFLDYFRTVVVPGIDLHPTRDGVVDQIALYGGDNDDNAADMLMLVGGLIGGSSNIIEQLQQRFSLTAERQGDWNEVGRWLIPPVPSA